MNAYLMGLFHSPEFIKILNNIYDKNVYNWANQYSSISNYFPLRHYNALLAIAVTLENISLNKKYMKNSTNLGNYKRAKIFEDILV